MNSIFKIYFITSSDKELIAPALRGTSYFVIYFDTLMYVTHVCRFRKCQLLHAKIFYALCIFSLLKETCMNRSSTLLSEQMSEYQVLEKIVENSTVEPDNQPFMTAFIKWSIKRLLVFLLRIVFIRIDGLAKK